jgi:hypothetical protein
LLEIFGIILTVPTIQTTKYTHVKVSYRSR